MNSKKIYSLDGNIMSEMIQEDYAQAKIFDKLRVGSKGVYYREGFRMHFLPYEELNRVFIRVNQVNARCCCGNTKYDYYRIVFVRGGKEIAEVLSENEKETDNALLEIAGKAPTVSIGTGK